MAKTTIKLRESNDDLLEFHLAKPLLIRSVSMFLIFLGIALLLYFRLDPWVIPLFIVIQHASDLAVKHAKKPGKSLHLSLQLIWGVIMAVEIIVLSLIMSRLLSRPISASAKNWITVLAVGYLILGLIGSAVAKRGIVYLAAVFIPLNALLWRFGYIHRRELVWLFGVEALIFLVWGLIQYFSLDEEKEAAIRREKIQGKLDKAKQVMQRFKHHGNEGDDTSTTDQQLEWVGEKLDKAKHVMEKFGVSSEKLDKVSFALDLAVQVAPASLALNDYLVNKYGFQPEINFPLNTDEPVNPEVDGAVPPWNLSIRLPKHMEKEKTEMEADIRSFLQENYPEPYASLRDIVYK